MIHQLEAVLNCQTSKFVLREFSVVLISLGCLLVDTDYTTTLQHSGRHHILATLRVGIVRFVFFAMEKSFLSGKPRIDRLMCSMRVNCVFIQFEGPSLAGSVWTALHDGSQAAAACTAGVADNTLHSRTPCIVGCGRHCIAVRGHRRAPPSV